MLDPLEEQLLRFLLISIIITTAFIIRTRTLKTVVNLYTLQSFFIAFFAVILFYYDFVDNNFVLEMSKIYLLMIAGFTFVSKCIIIPWVIRKFSTSYSQRDIIFDYLSASSSLFASLGVMVIVYLSGMKFLDFLSLTDVEFISIVTGISLAMMGLIIIFTRLKIVTDILGYLTMENGIVLISLILPIEMPFIIEVLVIIDLFMILFMTLILESGLDTTVEDFHKRLHPLKYRKKSTQKSVLISEITKTSDNANLTPRVERFSDNNSPKPLEDEKNA